MIGNTEFDQAEMVEKILHDMHRCVLLHVVTNLNNLLS